MDSTLQKLEKVLSAPIAVNSRDRTGELALPATLQKIVHETHSQDPERIPAVIFLYDDYSAMPKSEADQFVDQLQSSSVTVYGLVIVVRQESRWSNGWGEKGAIATYIAAQTGGSYLSVEAPQYAHGLERILNELHTRYELGFSPQALDGKRRSLRVTLSVEARKKHLFTRLTYRSGYVALRSPMR